MNIITACKCTHQLWLSHKSLSGIRSHCSFNGKNYANPHSADNVAMTPLLTYRVFFFIIKNIKETWKLSPCATYCTLSCIAYTARHNSYRWVGCVPLCECWVFEVTLTIRGPFIASWGSLPNFFAWCLLLDTAAFLQPSQLLWLYVMEVPSIYAMCFVPESGLWD